MRFDTIKNNPNYFSRGIIEVGTFVFDFIQAYFGTEEFFTSIGNNEGGKRVLCCDESSISVIILYYVYNREAFVLKPIV